MKFNHFSVSALQQTAPSAATTTATASLSGWRKIQRNLLLIYRYPCAQLVHQRYGWLAVLILAFTLPWFLYLMNPFHFRAGLVAPAVFTLLLYSAFIFSSYFLIFSTLARYADGFFADCKWCLGRQFLALLLVWVLIWVFIGVFKYYYQAGALTTVQAWCLLGVRIFLLGIVPLLLLQLSWPKLLQVKQSLGESVLPVAEMDTEYPPYYKELVYVESKGIAKILYYLDGEMLKQRRMRCSFDELKLKLHPDIQMLVCDRTFRVNIAYVDVAKSRKLKSTIQLKVNQLQLDVSSRQKDQVKRLLQDL
ncbi:MAG: hypothetical protein RIS29_2500 [Bacteroidota bacterium]|jgi:hypothetical protein